MPPSSVRANPTSETGLPHWKNIPPGICTPVTVGCPDAVAGAGVAADVASGLRSEPASTLTTASDNRCWVVRGESRGRNIVFSLSYWEHHVAEGDVEPGASVVLHRWLT